MRYRHLMALIVSTLFVTTPATAQAVGSWRVNGEINGKAFVVDCRFNPAGGRLSGLCTEVATGDQKGKSGKQHVISKGSFEGRNVRWTYPIKVMMMSIDLDFIGEIDGETMRGAVSAKGRQGTFSATKL